MYRAALQYNVMHNHLCMVTVGHGCISSKIATIHVIAMILEATELLQFLLYITFPHCKAYHSHALW